MTSRGGSVAWQSRIGEGSFSFRRDQHTVSSSVSGSVKSHPKLLCIHAYAIAAMTKPNTTIQTVYILETWKSTPRVYVRCNQSRSHRSLFFQPPEVKLDLKPPPASTQDKRKHMSLMGAPFMHATHAQCGACACNVMTYVTRASQQIRMHSTGDAISTNPLSVVSNNFFLPSLTTSRLQVCLSDPSDDFTLH